MPASALPISGSSQSLGVGVPSLYYGFTLRETTASATATVRIYDGTTAAGTLLETVKLASGESAREFYNGGIRVGTGVYVSIVSGTVEGSVRVG